METLDRFPMGEINDSRDTLPAAWLPDRKLLASDRTEPQILGNFATLFLSLEITIAKGARVDIS